RKADVYSLGATLAFLLTGETMLPGRPDVFALERHGVPRPVSDVIVSACAADPGERLATAEILLLALDELECTVETTRVRHEVTHRGRETAGGGAPSRAAREASGT